MRAADIAWLASVADDSKLIYDRKTEVVAELQAAFIEASGSSENRVNISVSTVKAEDEAKKGGNN